MPTLGNVQQVDPVLTGMLVDLRQANDNFVAERVLPAVPVDTKSGTYYILDKKHQFLDDLEERAPGATFEQRDFSFSTSTYNALQYAMEHPIPVEVRGNNQTGVDLQATGVNFLAGKSLLRKERALAAEAFAASVWTSQDNNSTTDWDDTTSGDPISDIRTGRRTINQLIGRKPNTFICGEIVHDALMVHPDILDRLKYVQVAGADSVIMAAMAAIFELQTYAVSYAVYNTANPGQTASLSPVIDDDALLVYLDNGMMSAGGMKLFTWEPGGGVGQISTYYSDERRADILQHVEQWDLKITAADSGYLWLDVV